MSVFQKLLPKTLETVNSPINGEIKVIEWFGKRKIVVNKLTQSGPVMEEIWEAAWKVVSRWYMVDSIENVLVLGLGGGSIIKVLQKKIPNAKVTAVDLDPLIIKLGKKYLGFKKNKNLKIIIEDAAIYVRNDARFPIRSGMTRKNFDLIFVDLFKGDKIPKFLENKEFLTDLKRILSKNGVIVFNRHYYQNHISEAKIFLDKIRGIFNDVNKQSFSVNTQKILTNLLIFCRNRKVA